MMLTFMPVLPRRRYSMLGLTLGVAIPGQYPNEKLSVVPI
jgi:hypothetical protein